MLRAAVMLAGVLTGAVALAGEKRVGDGGPEAAWCCA
jgi:hypothetical protein